MTCAAPSRGWPAESARDLATVYTVRGPSSDVAIAAGRHAINGRSIGRDLTKSARQTWPVSCAASKVHLGWCLQGLRKDVGLEGQVLLAQRASEGWVPAHFLSHARKVHNWYQANEPNIAKDFAKMCSHLHDHIKTEKDAGVC